MMLSMESLAVLPLARAEGIFLEALKSSVGHASFFVHIQYLYIYSVKERFLFCCSWLPDPDPSALLQQCPGCREGWDKEKIRPKLSAPAILYWLKLSCSPLLKVCLKW